MLNVKERLRKFKIALSMVKELKVSIADIVVRFISADPKSRFYLSPTYKDFIVREGKPDVVLYVHRGSIPEFPGEELIFDSSSAWTFSRSGEKYIIRIIRRNISRTSELVAMDPEFRSGDIYIDEELFSPFIPLDYLFRLLMIFLVPLNEGIEIHACGIIDNGKGMVFTGPSGFGKTTTANLWNGTEGVKVLNDERIIIRKRGGRFWVYGTPWHGLGGFALPDGAPLERIFFIRHAEENMITPKSGAEAASGILARVYFPSFDQFGLGHLLDICSQLASEVPCYELGFVPDERVIDFIRNME